MRYFTVKGNVTTVRPGGRPQITPIERVVREDALWLSTDGVRLDGQDIQIDSIEATEDVVKTNPAFKRLLQVIEQQRQWCFNMMFDETLFEQQAIALITGYVGEVSKPQTESERNTLITQYHVRARALMVQ
jgi:hypothetical protein